jgi:hypothetical protein
LKTQHNVEIKDLLNKMPKSITHSSQPTIKSLFQKQNQICGQNLKNQVDLAIMEMMTVNYQSIRLVEESGFIKLLNLLCPGYEIPSRRKISTKMMPYYFNSIRGSIVLAMKDVKFVYLTADSWTSRANDSYLAVTAHYIDNNFTLKTCVLAVTSVISKSGEDIAMIVGGIIEDYGLQNKVKRYVTDHASDMQVSAQILGINWFGCFAHKLNLIVQKAILVLKLMLLSINLMLL